MPEYVPGWLAAGPIPLSPAGAALARPFAVYGVSGFIGREGAGFSHFGVETRQILERSNSHGSEN